MEGNTMDRATNDIEMECGIVAGGIGFVPKPASSSFGIGGASLAMRVTERTMAGEFIGSVVIVLSGNGRTSKREMIGDVTVVEKLIG